MGGQSRQPGQSVQGGLPAPGRYGTRRVEGRGDAAARGFTRCPEPRQPAVTNLRRLEVRHRLEEVPFAGPTFGRRRGTVVHDLDVRRHHGQLACQHPQAIGVRRRAEVPHVRLVDVLGAVHPGPVPDAAARQDVDDPRDVVRLVVGLVLQRVAAEVDQQVDRDVLLPGRVGQVAHHVGPEAEADQHEGGAGVLGVDAADLLLELERVVQLAVVGLAEAEVLARSRAGRSGWPSRTGPCRGRGRRKRDRGS